jgi:diguanylate cyclase (GGDEF)-like protein
LNKSSKAKKMNYNYLDYLLERADIMMMLESLISAFKSPVFVENLDGNIIIGKSLSSWSQQCPIKVEQQTIGLVKGDETTLVLVFSQLLSYLASQERLVLFDDLTQIPNRRYYNRYLEQQWRCAIRDSASFSLLLCDLDFFKPFNDYYGHQMGDNCLRQVAKILTETTQRPADFVARYGGEELVVILPDTNSNGAETVAIKLKDAVEALKIPHHLSAISDYLTISIGIATTIPNSNLSSTIMVDTADSALYRAKARGRNRYCLQRI